MPKKKRTFKQKILSDLRQGSSSHPSASPLPPTEYKVEQSRDSIATSSYHYLFSDLLQTALLTGFVVIVEIVIHFVLKLI
jgi:hypothetical protein